MRIVVMDGYTLNPGDLSWNTISMYGDLKVYERTPVNKIIERCDEADIILTNKTPLSKSTIDELAQLKLISVLATGYNVIAINAAKEKGIVVCNAPAYGTASVAQHTFALILEIVNRVGMHAASVANGEWQKNPDWCYSLGPIMELSGKTLGIVGFGNIGRQVAKIATAFGMTNIYYSVHKKETEALFVDLQILFRESDFVSLHCPLTNANNQFVNKRLIQQMKPGAYPINTARGQLIHEQDLADALNDNCIAGAALDVLSTEPPDSNNPLLKARNCIITPHNAWISREARQRIMNITQKNIEAFLNNTPINKVN